MQRTVAVWFVLQQYDAFCFCVCSILRSTGYALQTPQPIRIIPPQYAAYRNDTMHTGAVRSYCGSMMRTGEVRFVLDPAFFSPDLGCQKTQKYSFRYDSYRFFFRQKYESYRAKKTVRDDSYRNDTVVGPTRVRSYCNDTFREHFVLQFISYRNDTMCVL